MPDRYVDLLEPEIAGLGAGGALEAAKLSTAISLRRIADALSDEAHKGLMRLLKTPAPWETSSCVGSRQPSLLETFLDTVARNGGTAIVDIEPRSDGSESTHAVATWEKSDVPGSDDANR